MTGRRLAAYAVLLGMSVLGSTSLHAQWLNYRTPGIPRLPDGKPNLTAPAPRTAEGRPDLTGVWLHELTSVEEMKRLFGPLVEEAIKVDVPGMEIGTQHKYGFNILTDFKPEDSPMRPATADIVRRRMSSPPPAQCGLLGIPGFPLAGCFRAMKTSRRRDHGGTKPAATPADFRRWSALPREFESPPWHSA
jgi:hypothetical protein